MIAAINRLRKALQGRMVPLNEDGFLSLGGIKHLVAQPIGGLAKVGGSALSLGGLVHNSEASRLTNIGHDITNPNKVYTGALNPLNFQQGAPGNWSTVATPQHAAPAATDQGQVQGDSTNVPDSGLYDGGGAGSYDPNTDPAAVGRLRGQITGLMDLFHQAFQDVVGRVDTMAAQKKADIIQNYDTQQQNLGTNYGNTAQSIDNISSGAGRFNSSYRAVDQGQAKDAFNQAVTALGQSKQGDLADVGQYADTTKAQLQASTPNYDVNNYGTVSDLQSISDAVNQALGQLKVSNAGLGTKGEYVQHLNSITPKQEQGSGKLKAQLAKLAGVNAPPDAKRAIAETIVNNNSTGDGNDQAWLDYFDKLLGQTGSGATSAVAQAPTA